MNLERLLELQGDLFADDCDISDPTILDWSEPDVIAYLESGGAIKPAAAPPPAPPPAPHPAPPPADSRKLEPPPAAAFTPHPQFKLTREHAQRLITLKRNADGKYFLGTQLKNGDYLRDGTILTDDDESGLDAGDKVLELGDSYQSLSTSCHHLPDIFSELDQNDSTYTVMSGLITYDELHELVRKKKLQGGLGIPVKELNDKGLKALWCALDVDNSNSLTGLEFGRFMQRMGAGKLTKGASQAREELLKKKATERRLQVEKEQAQEIADQKLESSISTKEMRKQLEEANMPLPGEKELDEMSKIFNATLVFTGRRLPSGSKT